MAADLIDELRHLLVASLRLDRDPGSIAPDALLFGGELGLDSLDAVQFLSAIEKHFGIEVPDRELGRSALDTLSSIAGMLTRLRVSR